MMIQVPSRQKNRLSWVYISELLELLKLLSLGSFSVVVGVWSPALSASRVTAWIPLRTCHGLWASVFQGVIHGLSYPHATCLVYAQVTPLTWEEKS